MTLWSSQTSPLQPLLMQAPSGGPAGFGRDGAGLVGCDAPHAAHRRTPRRMRVMLPLYVAIRGADRDGA